MDENGEMVHRFSLTMNNLGLAKAGHELVTMLRSGRWRKFSYGGATYEFLPGEFDYFLSQQGVSRDEVMAVRDVEVKARLETAMDERRTGEDGYRRTFTDVRSEVPERPGNPILPFGYTEKERGLLDGFKQRSNHRAALGQAVRRYSLTGGETTKNPYKQKPRWEQLLSSVLRLPNREFNKIATAITEEQQRRSS